MNTSELLQIVKDRGMRIELKDGVPHITGRREPGQVTDALLACLKRHREKIIKELSRTEAEHGRTGSGRNDPKIG